MGTIILATVTIMLMLGAFILLGIYIRMAIKDGIFKSE